MDIKEKWYESKWGEYMWDWNWMKLTNPRFQWMAILHLQQAYDVHIHSASRDVKPGVDTIANAPRPKHIWAPHALQGSGTLQDATTATPGATNAPPRTRTKWALPGLQPLWHKLRTPHCTTGIHTAHHARKLASVRQSRCGGPDITALTGA